MKNLKKIGALVLAVVMVMVMNITAFADGVAIGNGNTGTLASTNNQVIIPKGITLEGSLASVYSPNIEYTYTIAPASVTAASGSALGTKVTDNSGVTAQVYAGPADSASLSNNGKVTFTSAEKTKGEITENLVVTIVPSKFSKPGIYRYLITDTTTTDTLYAAGITRPTDYDTTRFLDVYVKNASAGSGFEVYGYVLTAGNEAAITTSTTKSNGYVAASEVNKTDTYKTIDVTLTKSVSGSAGDKEHQFPFTISVANNSLSFYGKKGTATVNDDQTNTSISITLANNESYSLVGLSPKATVTYSETNNTVDVYSLTVTDNASTKVKDTSDAEIDGAPLAVLNGSKTTKALAVSNYDTDNSSTSVAATVAASNNAVITFTNNLDAISPTGVALRVAPYALILAAGVVLLVLSKKRRPVED